MPWRPLAPVGIDSNRASTKQITGSEPFLRAHSEDTDLEGLVNRRPLQLETQIRPF